ncbi:PRTRC system ThiF family protein [Pseudoduganella sp. SL102]|uniref:PRTRC system ThiF family protein n=1 Tax=Pseudoduganella sp. SL102 TaxID=2995154 RepID=UPI00248C0E69|nr:PRTRC system ThiF family protein [Pseudoduganella sp. SL102]WBS00135.1 PRTRC system ThiF family protein [Pseudoduganella sp. SL102]
MITSLPHRIPGELLTRRVTIHLAGVGGNGAQMAGCLARLDIAMRALGHPGGLHVHAFDPDTVSEANVGRQLYSHADVGAHKAVVTISRLNQFYGLDWDASVHAIEDTWRGDYSLSQRNADMLISCVDTRAARRRMHAYLFAGDHYRYWLDLGNSQHDAQVVLGQPPTFHRPVDAQERLRCVTERYPELLDDTAQEDDTPSCSVRMSLASQGLFINDVAARYAAQLLFELFTSGGIESQGVVIDLQAKRAAPMRLMPAEGTNGPP